MRLKIFLIGLLLLPSFIINASEPDELNELDLDLDFDIDIEETTSGPLDLGRIILAWQNGVDINAVDNIKTHRFDVRLDWGKLIFNDYFFKIDGKAIIRLPGDDNQANQNSIELDGRLRELYIPVAL